MCDCIEQVNNLLADKNAKVAQSLVFNMEENSLKLSGAKIELEKIDTKKRKALPSLFASFCPICGKKY